MYISLNKSNMRFYHKHESLIVVLNLVDIELSHKDDSVLITPFDNVAFFDDFTQAELELLYRNTTGKTDVGLYGDALKAVMCAIAGKLPITDANTWETVLQASYVRGKEGLSFSYAKGSNIPISQQTLWAQDHLVVDTAVLESALADSSKHNRPHRPREDAAVSSAARVGYATPQPPAAARTPAISQQRTRGAREKVWATADRMWEEAGKPSSKDEILLLRRKIMDVLEADGVKRNSSSNELGNWQKSKLS